MNRILFLTLIMSLSAAMYAQFDRMVLLEEFTQASCGPCASQNPGFNALLQENTDIATSIKYQVWWPGYDPMYEHNTSDVDTRVDYYGITGVPHALMDGVNIANDCGYYVGAPACVSQTDIDLASASSSPFLIELSHVVSDNYDHIDVTMHITAGADVSGALSAHIVVVEEEVIFDNPPGSNGEKEFYNVMKKMLPSANGTTLSDTWAPGDEITLTESWNFANVYDPSEIAVVAFIQDNATGMVYQAAYSAPYPVYLNDVLNVSSNLTGSNNRYLCDGNTSPLVTVKNTGEEVLNSLTISYSVNGEDQEPYSWSGSLPFGERETISLPMISFLLNDENELAVTLSEPNGTADDFDNNNESTAIALAAPESPTNTIHLKLRTDNYASETTWQVINEDGDVMAEGGPYNGQNNQVVFDNDIALPASGCYDFIIYDEYGDGICCTYGSGYYEITDTDGAMLVEGGAFGSEDLAIVKVTDVVGTDEIPALEWLMYPNPATDLVQLQLPGNSHYLLEITDMTGRPVLTERSYSSGNHTLHTENLAPGMYQVILRSDLQISSQLLTIQ